MFRVECIVDDRYLAKVLYALTGLVSGSPNVQPMVNAQVKNGKVTAVSSGNSLDMFAGYLKQQKLATITPKELKAVMPHLGLSEKSYSNVLNKAIKAGVLKRAGKGNYKVISHG